MKMKIVVFGVVAFGAATLAHGQTSYELLLVADQGTKSVQRFDPMTGRSLGQFGNGILNGALDIGVNQSTGEVHVHEGGGRILKFDYSTGLYRGRWDVMGNAIGFHRTQGGSFLAWSTNVVALYNSNGTFDRSFTMAAGVNIRGADIAANGGNGLLLVGTRNAADSPHTRGYDLANNTNSLNQFWIMDRATYRSNIGVNTFEISGSRYIERDVSSGSFLDFRGQLNVTTIASRLGQPAWGHVYPGTLGLAYVPARNAANTAGLIIRYDSDYGILRGTFGEGVLNDPRGSAIVLAPEPGTMIALGLGLAGIVARRRRKR